MLGPGSGAARAARFVPHPTHARPRPSATNRAARVGWTRALVLLVLTGLAITSTRAAEVRNSSFREARGATNTPEVIAKLRQNGWKCPDAKQWPHSWGGQGASMTVEFPMTGGRGNDSYCRLTGGVNGYVNGYWGKHFKESQVLEFWARGKGTLRVGLMAYKLSDDRKRILPGGRMPHFDVRVNSKDWMRYRYLMRKPEYELTGHPLFQVPQGTIDFDDVDILDSDRAFDLIVSEENKLYGKKALVEDVERAKIDTAFDKRRSDHKAAVAAFESITGKLAVTLSTPMQKRIVELRPYVHTDGITTIRATHYNDMIVLTRVLNRLAGKTVGAADTVQAMKLDPTASKPHFPGKREARLGTLTITRVRSNKVRYVENETATTTATIVNESADKISGTLQARMILDVDTVREIASVKDYALASGEEKTWQFTYGVGPETYGRAIEVELVDKAGKTIDKWQEYYAVAAEFFRVHQHSYQIATKYWPADPHIFYFNQSHYFAHEPTALGIEPFDAEVYIAGQVGYRINVANRKAQMAHNKRQGIANSYYVTGSLDSQMGYEQVRQHPEFIIYDANGQPAHDPIYGGYPNPMELASPIEVGPKRKKMKIKPYLDREITPWQHVNMNMANEDAVRWAIERMKVYADEWGFDGIYWDGCLGVWSGHNHKGEKNVPSGKYEDFVALGARNHVLFNQILKRDNPNFGVWLNWGLEGATGDFARNNGITIWLGSGVKGDPLDDNVRAATDAPNVMLLDEHARFAGFGYHKLLSDRLRSRDHYVQKYKANHIIGYASTGVNIQEPGPSKWGWPAWNHVLSQLIATQSHLASTFVPSQRPGFQFMTRYSRFLWAPDIKAIPQDEAQQLIDVQSAEELWWKRLVYERKTEKGREIIVHLVRIPPTQKVDYAWADEPRPLKGTTVTVDTTAIRLMVAHACRPYHYEDPQQVVQSKVSVTQTDAKATLEIPPFRYYTMLVIRLEQSETSRK